GLATATRSLPTLYLPSLPWSAAPVPAGRLAADGWTRTRWTRTTWRRGSWTRTMATPAGPGPPQVFRLVLVHGRGSYRSAVGGMPMVRLVRRRSIPCQSILYRSRSFFGPAARPAVEKGGVQFHLLTVRPCRPMRQPPRLTDSP